MNNKIATVNYQNSNTSLPTSTHQPIDLLTSTMMFIDS